MRLDELFVGIGYEPHVAQLTFHDNDARFKLLIAGARFGKSLASARDVLIDLLSGSTRGWLVGPTYGLARPEFRYIRDDLLRGISADAVAAQTAAPPSLTTRWGGEVICMSAHMPETLLGEEIDWLILCEAAHIRREAFERFLRARLVTRNGRLLLPTTPAGHNWIYELYEWATRQEEWAVLQAATWDNPRVGADEIEQARASLSPETFDEQFGGEFRGKSGRVYPEFDRRRHVAKGLTPPPGATIVHGMDVGYTNPLACLWGYLDADGCLNILRERYVTKQAMALHIEAVRAIDNAYSDQGCHLGPIYIDPSGAAQRDELKAAGMTVINADNRVAKGIEVVRGRLVSREVMLRIDDSCKNLLREIENYLWDEQGNKPGSGDDHALDALRYLCASLSRRVDWKQSP